MVVDRSYRLSSTRSVYGAIYPNLFGPAPRCRLNPESRPSPPFRQPYPETCVYAPLSHRFGITTNLTFAHWTEVFSDERLTAALLGTL